MVDHPGRVVDGVSFTIKFWTDQRYVFRDIVIFTFWQFGLKFRFDDLPPFFGERGEGGRGTFSQMMSLIVLTPKRTVLGLNHVI